MENIVNDSLRDPDTSKYTSETYEFSIYLREIEYFEYAFYLVIFNKNKCTI